jgi:hypothetical protein
VSVRSGELLPQRVDRAREPSRSNLIVGVAIATGRSGADAIGSVAPVVRPLLRPADAAGRMLARSGPGRRAGSALDRALRRLDRSGGHARRRAEQRMLALLDDVIDRVVDRTVARLIQAGLVERITAEMIAAGVPERVADQLAEAHVVDLVLETPATQRLVDATLESPALERRVAGVLESSPACSRARSCGGWWTRSRAAPR